MTTITLFRPVGMTEFELVQQAGYKAFPPRLYWQPIFYPVLNQAYAEQIAFEWNTHDEFSGFCGIVLAFDVDAAYCGQFPVQIVGGDLHQELWVPAESLDEFNRHIQGPIRVVNAFFGKQFHHTKTLPDTLTPFITT
jgi:hypothetical protein